MFNWIACYLSGRHDYQVRCEPGAIFLTCHQCGRRSMGWELRPEPHPDTRVPVPATRRVVATHAHATR